MKTVADQFAETLAAAGVKRIYGILGDSLNGPTDAIRRQGKIEWFMCGTRRSRLCGRRLAFGVLIVFVVVAGSMWIMADMNQNMMIPSTEPMTMRMQH
jgi:hypothetical protein